MNAHARETYAKSLLMRQQASQMAQQKPLVKLPQKQPSPAKAKVNPTPRGKGFVWKNLWSPAQ